MGCSVYLVVLKGDACEVTLMRRRTYVRICTILGRIRNSRQNQSHCSHSVD